MKKFILVVLVVVLCAPMLLARREANENREARQSQKQAMRKCNYQWSECKIDGGVACGAGKKTGTDDSAECTIKHTERSCRIKCPKNSDSPKPLGRNEKNRNCKYRPPATETAPAPCNPKTRKQPVVHELIGSDPNCPKTKTVPKRCSPGGNRRKPRNSGDEDEEIGAAGPADSRCKYRKGQKGECNPTTSKRTVTMVLKRKSPASCPATKTVEKPCKVKQPKPARKRPNNRRRNQEQ